MEAEARGIGAVHSEVRFPILLRIPELLADASLDRNVLKYYQLVEHTCSKPPRISKMEERMDKLVAYLRKFRDLNIRILVRPLCLIVFRSHGLTRGLIGIL